MQNFVVVMVVMGCGRKREATEKESSVLQISNSAYCTTPRGSIADVSRFAANKWT